MPILLVQLLCVNAAMSCPIDDLKFDPEMPILLNWLKEEKIFFVECGNLSLNKAVASHKAQLAKLLKMIEMANEDAVSCDEEQMWSHHRWATPPPWSSQRQLLSSFVQKKEGAQEALVRTTATTEAQNQLAPSLCFQEEGLEGHFMFL